MEKQHQIPQDISTYQFKLIGDMTIKQFFQVAAGALVAIILYSSNLPAPIKWFGVIFSFLAGVAFAFFPLQDRPLSKWVSLFIKSIYTPTVFSWKKTPVKPVFFQVEPTQQPALPAEGILKEPVPTKTSIEDLISPPLGKISEKLEKEEQEFLTKLSQHFKTLSSQPEQQTKSEDEQTKPTQLRKIPEPISIKIESSDKSQKTALPQKPATPASPRSKVTPFIGQKPKGVQAAKFSAEAAPPVPPSKANIIVGQVIDSQGKIIEAAILEIKDGDGRPVRALKSNKLGHFMIVTPLYEGKYEIITEKEGFIFDPISFEAKGEIIPPIAIQAKEQVSDSLSQ